MHRVVSRFKLNNRLVDLQNEVIIVSMAAKMTMNLQHTVATDAQYCDHDG